MKKVRFVSLALAGLSVLSVARATTIAENFSTNPFLDGWRIFGDTNLFRWKSTNHDLPSPGIRRSRTVIFIIYWARF